MQTLKQDKQEKIILAAKEEFLAKNYKVASLRSIAGKCDISVSNLYNYFPNKLELFQFIVNPVKSYFLSIFMQFQDFEKIHGFQEEAFIDFVVEKFGFMLTIYGQEFIILMETGQGTEHSDFKQEVINEITSHFLEHSKGNGNQKLMKIIATNFVNGMLEIARMNLGRGEKNKLLKQFMIYHFTGIQEIF
ncbi:MAG: TetR/AcrR family transcriptional regulator [Candidatus Marinimicrobia bacterium]|nr:TetR/AcrR family transcriptional regulator [Candidatus Neomarinimicrobiota bacterium]